MGGKDKSLAALTYQTKISLPLNHYYHCSIFIACITEVIHSYQPFYIIQEEEWSCLHTLKFSICSSDGLLSLCDYSTICKENQCELTVKLKCANESNFPITIGVMCLYYFITPLFLALFSVLDAF